MKIAVATENPVKIRAVEAALAEAFKGEEIAIQRITLDLGLPEQPMGDGIAAGATARAAAAQKHTNADLGIGIEAGLCRFRAQSAGCLFKFASLLALTVSNRWEWGRDTSCLRPSLNPCLPVKRYATPSSGC